MSLRLNSGTRWPIWEEMYLLPHLDKAYLTSLLLIILAESAAMAGIVRLIMGRIDRHRRRVGFPVLIPIARQAPSKK